MINLFWPNLKICLFLKVTNPHAHERPAKPMAFPKRLKIALKKLVACRGWVNSCLLIIYISNCLVFNLFIYSCFMWIKYKHHVCFKTSARCNLEAFKTGKIFGFWLSIWDLKISNLKIVGQIFKSPNFQINKSTNQRINPDLPPMIFIHGCTRIYTDVFLLLSASGKESTRRGFWF